MRRTVQYIAILLVLALCSAGGTTWWAYEAVQEVRPFYAQAMSVQPSVLREAGQELSSRATALVNDVCRDEPWQATFTEDQINGWLAFDLPEKHAELIPKDVSDPRVAIDDGRLSLGARYTGGRLKAVFTVDVEPYVAEPNVLSLKILSATAGTLPVPVSEVTERLTRAAERFGLQLSWIQESEVPTALVRLKLRSKRHGRKLRLDLLTLDDDSLHLQGVTEQEEEATAAAADPARGAPTAESDETTEALEAAVTPPPPDPKS
jgi:uncharacterized protein YpmS